MTLLRMVTLSPQLLLCPSKKQKYFFLVMVFLALFNNLFKAESLFLMKYVAEIKLPGNGI
jgi:hypothetical protein